ncbi:hypothetical protein [Neptuniibacter sp. QD48_11]|uniref:hypothetical protein n=1 Tax=Neptuniibacter sp. QD48_11 TaxID=3398211 RepID=UPI0039F4BEC0
MIPEIFAKPYVTNKQVIRIEGVAEFPQLTVYAMYPTRKYLPYKVNLFLDFLKGNTTEFLP